MQGKLRARRTEFIPEELLDPAHRGRQGDDRYSVTVAEVGLTGRGIWNAAMLDGPEHASMAALRAGVVDYHTPHADGVDRHYGSDLHNRETYEDWDEDLVEWVLGLVNELNHFWRPLSDAEAAEALAEAGDAEADDELEDEDDGGDERGNSSGSPSEPLPAGPPATSAAGTPSPPPSSTSS